MCDKFFLAFHIKRVATFQMAAQTNGTCKILKVTGHGIMHYLWSADLLKSFLKRLCQHLSLLNIFLQQILPGGKCGVTPHCLYRDS